MKYNRFRNSHQVRNHNRSTIEGKINLFLGGGISRVIFHQGGSEIIYSPPPWGYENLPPAAGYITPSLLKKNQSTSPDFNDNVWVDAKSHEISKKSYEWNMLTILWLISLIFTQHAYFLQYTLVEKYVIFGQYILTKNKHKKGTAQLIM